MEISRNDYEKIVRTFKVFQTWSSVDADCGDVYRMIRTLRAIEKQCEQMLRLINPAPRDTKELESHG